ncbi:MAG: flagellar basal body rod protein FlgB [Alphaproteobacteria bacterium]|nr:flagellar basal body rod protein FlgB [Alphaproteobacteria bacterium]
MDLGSLPVFKMMTAKMDWLGRRQRVLAQNIANADTPDYVPKDLKAIDFKDARRRESFRLQLAVTNSGHVQSKIQQSSIGDEKKDRQNYEVSPTGNAVVLEEQLIKVADTAGAHQLVTNLYRKNLGLFRIALGRQSGQ